MSGRAVRRTLSPRGIARLSEPCFLRLHSRSLSGLTSSTQCRQFSIANSGDVGHEGHDVPAKPTSDKIGALSRFFRFWSRLTSPCERGETRHPHLVRTAPVRPSYERGGLPVVRRDLSDSHSNVCTARGFWDIGLNPTPPRRPAEAAAVETVSA
jgi:hypothetical protein